MTETIPAWQAFERDTSAQAAELRAASALMRARAADAEAEGFGSDHPGKPWCPTWTYQVVRHVARNVDSECGAHPQGAGDEADCNTWGRYAGSHIAGMHPGVALAMADWLDAKAANLERAATAGHHYRDHDYGYALAVARAYLGGGPNENSGED